MSHKKLVFNCLEDCLKSNSRVVAQTARVLLDAKRSMTVSEIAELTQSSKAYVGESLRTIRLEKFAYICGWKKVGVHAMVALYIKGEGKDVPREPNPRAKIYRTKELQYMLATTRKEINLAKRFNDINAALVPARNMKQQRVVNSRYLNHIQGIR